VGCPILIGTVDAVGAVERRTARAGVSWLERVDTGRLDFDWDICQGAIHSRDDHACDLGCDGVVGYAVDNVVRCALGEEMEKVVVCVVEIFAVLPAIV